VLVLAFWNRDGEWVTVPGIVLVRWQRLPSSVRLLSCEQRLGVILLSPIGTIISHDINMAEIWHNGVKLLDC
jgi:hypothetical protein